jgi:asparagine synthase (glutamine-hydrolysing)
VAEFATKSVKVLLNGQGPDELLGGYYHCFDYYVKTRFRQLSRDFGKAEVGRMWQELSAIADLTGKPIAYYLLFGLIPYSGSVISWGKRKIRERVLTPEFAKVAGQGEAPFNSNHNGCDPLSKYLSHLAFDGPLASLLHYADRNTMAFSIEARLPFLDHRLVEFCLGLPLEWKIRGSTTKYILRKSMEDVLPSEVAWRRDKKGFPTPIASWLRQGESYIRDILSPRAIHLRGILKPDIAIRMIDEHMSGQRDHGWEIWRWLTMELWFQQFVDRP